MKRFNTFFSILLLALFFNSCSVAFLTKKKQQISVANDSTCTIAVKGVNTTIENGKFTLIKDGKPKQITIKREGYKDEYRVMVPYRKSPVQYVNYGINMLIGAYLTSAFIPDEFSEMDIPAIIIGLYIGNTAGYMANYISPRLNLYDESLIIQSKEKILYRDSTMKELYLNKVSFDVPVRNLKFQAVNYNNYRKGKFTDNKTVNFKSNKEIKVDNTVFSDEINKILKKNGFIDTSGIALRGGYRENLYLDAKITDFNFSIIQANKPFRRPQNYVPENYFSVLKIKTRWDILDIYKNIIYSDTLSIQSGEFEIDDDINDDDYIKQHINDALESGLYRLMNSEKFRSVMALSKTVVSEYQTEFEVPKSLKYVESLEDAVNATATLKTKNGHGSCFFISENGYLITNYHVISDSSKLEVVLNDGSKFKTSIIRFNKDADLALLKIDKNGLIPFNIASNDQLNMGKEIYVIGTPSAEDLSQTLSKGIISSVRKQSNGSKVIQTDASVNPGNSGGPLVDSNGSLLGVVNSKLSGIGIEGISFSIPASTIIPTLKLKINN